MVGRARVLTVGEGGGTRLPAPLTSIGPTQGLEQRPAVQMPTARPPSPLSPWAVIAARSPLSRVPSRRHRHGHCCAPPCFPTGGGTQATSPDAYRIVCDLTPAIRTASLFPPPNVPFLAPVSSATCRRAGAPAYPLHATTCYGHTLPHQGWCWCADRTAPSSPLRGRGHSRTHRSHPRWPQAAATHQCRPPLAGLLGKVPPASLPLPLPARS